MHEERQKRANQIIEDLQHCIEQSGLKVEIIRGEDEITIAARDSDDDQAMSVIAQVAQRRAKPFGIGSIDAEVRRANMAQMYVRPSLGARAASGSQAEDPEVP